MHSPKTPSRPLACALLALLGSLLAAPAIIAADPERGAELANTCLGCHGIEGYRNAYPSYRVPKLGGQHAEYVVLALQGYRNQTREHPTMHAQAATLSDQDMADIAAFFASQGEAVQEQIVVNGRAARGEGKVAVCAACHGEGGISTAGNWPTLAGQYQDYLLHSLQAYRDGGRKDPVMAGQVMNLTDEDMRDIAAFFAAQSGLFTVDYSN